MTVFFGRFGFLTNLLQFIKFFVSQFISGGSWPFGKHLLHPEPFLVQFLNNFTPDEFLLLPFLLEDFPAMDELNRWLFRRHIQDNSGLGVKAGDKIKDDGLIVGLPFKRLNPTPHIKLLHIDHNITKRSITTVHSTSASISPGQFPCSSRPHRTAPSHTPAARTSTCFRKLH